MGCWKPTVLGQGVLAEGRQKRHLTGNLESSKIPGGFRSGFCVFVCIAVLLLFCFVSPCLWGRAGGIELGAFCDSLGPRASLDGGG